MYIYMTASFVLWHHQVILCFPGYIYQCGNSNWFQFIFTIADSLYMYFLCAEIFHFLCRKPRCLKPLAWLPSQHGRPIAPWQWPLTSARAPAMAPTCVGCAHKLSPTPTAWKSTWLSTPGWTTFPVQGVGIHSQLTTRRSPTYRQGVALLKLED